MWLGLFAFIFVCLYTAELQLSGLIGKASRLDMHKSPIIGISLEISYIGCLMFGFIYQSI